MSTITLPKFKLAGMRLPENTSNIHAQSSLDCGNLWQKFKKNQVRDSITGKLSDAIYAVYFDYDNDHNGSFSYFIGCKVPLDKEYSNLDTIIIPAQSYIKKTAKGKMPDCMANAWENIWQSSIARSYGYDFEIYDRRSEDWSNAAVDIFISIMTNTE